MPALVTVGAKTYKVEEGAKEIYEAIVDGFEPWLGLTLVVDPPRHMMVRAANVVMVAEG